MSVEIGNRRNEQHTYGRRRRGALRRSTCVATAVAKSFFRGLVKMKLLKRLPDGVWATYESGERSLCFLVSYS